VAWKWAFSTVSTWRITSPMAIFWVGVFPQRGGTRDASGEPSCSAPSRGKTWRRFQGSWRFFLPSYFVLFGAFMCIYYQVVSGFKLSRCKPSLVSLSLHSTTEYYTWLVRSASSPLSQSRFFLNVTDANLYIDYLFHVYPSCSLPRPVLDSNQILLF
jgi:hypothetical protein